MSSEDWRAELERLWDEWAANSAAYSAAWMVHSTGATPETLRRLDACRVRENALLERLSRHLEGRTDPTLDVAKRQAQEYRALWEGDDRDG